MIPTHAQKSLKFVHSSLPMHNKSNYLGIGVHLFIIKENPISLIIIIYN
jgi:hypothetical protein